MSNLLDRALHAPRRNFTAFYLVGMILLVVVLVLCRWLTEGSP